MKNRKLKNPGSSLIVCMRSSLITVSERVTAVTNAVTNAGSPSDFSLLTKRIAAFRNYIGDRQANWEPDVKVEVKCPTFVLLVM